MSPIEVGFVVFGCAFGGSLFGMFLHKILPEEHLQSNSTDVVKLATGLVVTMTGLVLGMLVSSALGFYNKQKGEMLETSAKLILLDRVLGEYGEETRDVRSGLRRATVTTLNQIWPDDPSKRSDLKPMDDMRDLYAELQTLSPKNNQQTSDKEQAMSMARELYETHWLMFIESGGNSVSRPLLMIVTSWLTVIFISFGLLAQRNGTVIVTLIVCALAVSAAIFIIEEMYDPYGGMFRIPSAPIRGVLDQIGH